MTDVTPFNYEILTSETRGLVQEHTGEIKKLARCVAQDIVEIGQRLIEVKATLGHGQFREWIKTEFGWGRSMAHHFIQVAETFKDANVQNLDISPSALYLLASGSTPDAVRDEMVDMAHATGQPITHAQVKKRLKNHAEPETVQVLSDEEEQPSVTLSPHLPTTPVVDNPDMAPRKPKKPYTPLPVELEERTLSDGSVVKVPALPETPKQQELSQQDWEKASRRFESAASSFLSLITSLEMYTPEQLRSLMESPEGRASGVAVRIRQIKRRTAELQEAWGFTEDPTPTIDAERTQPLIEILPPRKNDDDDTLLN